MKIFRLWGIVAFFILGVILALSWYFVAPFIIANGIEEVGSEALGAKVSVDKVDVALFPLRIKINRLQATDPDQPMTNLFEAEQINFAVDSKALLWKKVLIDELTISGIQMGTKRASSGELAGGRRTAALAKDIASVELPELTEENIKEMVSKADLITIKRLKALDQTQKDMHDYWKTALDENSTQERLLLLQEEFNRLSKRAKENKLNLLTDGKKWKKLKKNIDLERKNISELKDKIKTDKKVLQQQISSVRQGPKDDLAAIMNQTGLGSGIGGLSDKFLGPQFTPWIEKAVAMTSEMSQGSESGSENDAPVYSTSKGKFVQFKDKQIFPDLLINKVNLSGKDTDWELSGLGSNIGYFPWLVGKPANLNIDLTGDGNASLALNSNWANANEMHTKINTVVSDWQINHMKLMQTDQGSWVVNSGKFDSTLKGHLTLEKVDLKLSLTLSKPSITAPENLTGWQKTLASSLNQQQQLTLEVIATGSIDNPKINVKSSLEKLFSAAIGEKVKQQAEKLKGKFTTAISEKVGDLSSLDGITGGFDQWSEQLKGNDELLNNLKKGI